MLTGGNWCYQIMLRKFRYLLLHTEITVFNQLRWKSSIREKYLARAWFTWSSLKRLLIARSRMWPKQPTCNQSRLLKPATIFEKLSVVVATSWPGFRSQWTKTSVTASEKFWPVWFSYREKWQDRMTASLVTTDKLNSKRCKGNSSRAGPKISSCREVLSLYEPRLHNTSPYMVLELGQLVLWKVLPWREFIVRI